VRRASRNTSEPGTLVAHARQKDTPDNLACIERVIFEAKHGRAAALRAVTLGLA